MNNQTSRNSVPVAVKAPLFALLVVTITVAGGCAGQSHFVEDVPVTDVGRNAAIVLAGNLHVQELVDAGNLSEARSNLESSYLYQLTLLRHFDAQLRDDERHIRIRNKVVEKLQTRWLKEPPDYLDDESASFLEAVCRTIAQCPSGKVKPKKPLPEMPK